MARPIPSPLPYAIHKAAYETMQRNAEIAGAALNAIPGIGTGPMGLTPDHIKASPDYRAKRRAYDFHAAQLRRTAAFMAKHFKAEMLADRDAARAAKMAAIQSA